MGILRFKCGGGALDCVAELRGAVLVLYADSISNAAPRLIVPDKIEYRLRLRYLDTGIKFEVLCGMNESVEPGCSLNIPYEPS